jgi:hypothetical protein
MGRHKIEATEKKPKVDTALETLKENYALSVRKRRQVLDMIASLPEDPDTWDHHERDYWKDLHSSAVMKESVGEIK